jgi:outer membrane receptor protein involved in Fe transport
MKLQMLAPSLVCVCLAFTPAVGEDNPASDVDRELRGRVVVQGSDRPVGQAVVTLIELDRRTTTDQDGEFRFSRMPRGVFTLGVHAVSYASIHRRVRVPLDGPLTLPLNPDSHFQEEVTVTALPYASSPLDSPRSVDMVDQERIRGGGDNSVGGALEHVPGVANIGTGDALGTPVIRGISENRIRVMTDGVPTNYQQWSFRHSPNIEPGLAERIEVVRGPASVMWGPDAMGGVVNVVRPPLPSTSNGNTTFEGDVGLGYFTNNDQGQGQAVLEGARGGFGWRIGALRRDAGDLETPEGPLENTDYDQTNATAVIGFTGTWGLARLRWDRWDNDVGFFFPEGDPRDRFRLDLEDNTYAADLTLPTRAGDVLVVLSHQDNLRRARPFPELPPTVDLDLDTDVARVGLTHRQLGRWKGKVAVEYQSLANLSLGPATLVPDYDGDGHSVMAFEEGRFLPVPDGSRERLILNLGLRYDRSRLRVPDAATVLVPPGGFDRAYDSVTGSLGLVYRATERFSLAANAGRGWRPPSAFELFADGDHVGVGAYQLGNPTLGEESNFGRELSARYQAAHWRFILTRYRSDFEDYIYLQEVTDDPDLPPGLPEPVFSYGQTDATNAGWEASFSVVPLEELQLGLLYSNVDTENKTTGTTLPQTPPDRVSLSVRGMARALGALADPFIELEGVWVADGVPSGPDEPFFGSGNAATDRYKLLNLRAGFRFVREAGVLDVDLTVRNLLDTTYTDFLYPYKVWGVPNPGRDVRLILRYLW